MAGGNSKTEFSGLKKSGDHPNVLQRVIALSFSLPSLCIGPGLPKQFYVKRFLRKPFDFRLVGVAQFLCSVSPDKFNCEFGRSLMPSVEKLRD